jgi:hypothetical protein
MRRTDNTIAKRQTMVVLIQHRKLKIEQREHHWKCGWTFGIKEPKFGRSNHPISINYFLLVVSIHNNLEHSLFERSVCLMGNKISFVFPLISTTNLYIYLIARRKQTRELWPISIIYVLDVIQSYIIDK